MRSRTTITINAIIIQTITRDLISRATTSSNTITSNMIIIQGIRLIRDMTSRDTACTDLT